MVELIATLGLEIGHRLKERLRAKAKSLGELDGRKGKLQRSTSLSLRGGSDPSIAYLDDNNIQVVILSPPNYHIPSLSHHEETPGDSSLSVAASLKGETDTGISETTPQDHDKSSLKRELYEHALQGDWPGAKSIYDKFPDMVRIPLTASGDTALHVAVSANNIDFVHQLVELMTPENLQIQNKDRNTAFCMAAILGIGDCFQIMIQKNPNLPVIPGHNNMLPVHLAAFTGHHNVVKILTSDDLLEKMASERQEYIDRLFLMTISGDMYDVATKLFDKYPDTLTIARDDKERLTALHILARKPSEEFNKQEENNYNASSIVWLWLADQLTNMVKNLWTQVKQMREEKNNEASSRKRDDQFNLVKKLWTQVRQMGEEEMLALINDPWAVLFDAVKSGNTYIVKWILLMNPELLKIKDPTSEQNLLHLAAFHRQKSIFEFILKMKTANLLIFDVDNFHDNVLHYAARFRNETSPILRPSIVMQRELEWFKEAEESLPTQLRTMKNRKGKKPRNLFYAAHFKLSKEVTDAAKQIGKSGMIVAVLIVTVAFAAAVTVPGDKTNNWFIVFILANAVALITSSTSIISFLSIFTSSKLTESEYIVSLHPSVKAGLLLVLMSIAAMIVAFVAASFLIFQDRAKWAAYLVASLLILPIEFLWYDQFGFGDYKDVIDHFFRSKSYNRLSKGN